jgi:hypothetical protein
MGMHTLDDLKLKWQREEVTAEQMMGQVLQHMEVLYDRLRLLEKAYNAERRAQEQPVPQQAKRPGKR